MSELLPLRLIRALESAIDSPRAEELPFLDSLDQTLRHLFPEGRGAEIEASGQVPFDELRAFAASGGLAPFVPGDIGGDANWPLAMRTGAYFAAHEPDALLCLGGALLGSFPVLCAGTLEQKTAVYESLQKGHLAAFGVSEWAHGLDLLGNESYAEPIDAEGRACSLEHATHFRLNGCKAPVNNASEGFHLAVAMRTSAGREANSQSLFLLRRDMDGLHKGSRFPSIGYRCMDLSSIVMTDLVVPRSALLGEVGEGFVHARRALEISRSGVATMAAGFQVRVLAIAAAHAQTRQLYGAPISALEAIRSLLAGLYARSVEAIALARMTAHLMNHAAVSARVLTAVCKYQIPWLLDKSVQDAGTLLGARSLMEDLPLARARRTAPLFAIFDGSSFLQKDEIWRGMISWPSGRTGGVQRYHELRRDTCSFQPWSEDESLLAMYTPPALLQDLHASLPALGLDAAADFAQLLAGVVRDLRRAPQSLRFLASELVADLYGLSASALAVATTSPEQAALLLPALRLRFAEFLLSAEPKARLLGVSPPAAAALEQAARGKQEAEEAAASSLLSLVDSLVI